MRGATKWRAAWEELALTDSTVLPVILALSVLALGVAIDWMRAARLPSARLRAIWDSVGGLAFCALLLTNVGGLGASFAYGLMAVSALPLAWIVWAAVILFELVMLGIEMNRLASARDSESRP
jgi:hypothetical protein